MLGEAEIGLTQSLANAAFGVDSLRVVAEGCEHLGRGVGADADSPRSVGRGHREVIEDGVVLGVLGPQMPGVVSRSCAASVSRWRSVMP
jgi:hypothetical protein